MIRPENRLPLFGIMLLIEHDMKPVSILRGHAFDRARSHPKAGFLFALARLLFALA
jgi:hypothetical protein